MRKIKFFASLLLVMVMALPAVAQKRNINLTISVAGPSGNPVPSAAVVLKQTDYALSYGAITLNEQGSATLKVYAGNHSLEASAKGYASAATTFEVTRDTAVTVTLDELMQRPYSLGAIVSHDTHTGLNNLTFTWNTELPVFFDDFEQYDAFAIKFGEWIGIDGDGVNAAMLSGSYLNQGVRQYAQIINPLTVSPPWWYDYPVLRPYSGKQYAGFTRTATGAANDDWLITPAITPGNQNVFSFMAKAADVYKEKFQVYVTEKIDDPAKADFKLLNSGNYETVDYKGWKTFTYDASKYAGKTVRFAIRYISEANTTGAFMLMVDDVYVGQATSNPNAAQAKKARRVAAKSPANPNEQFRVFFNDAEVGMCDGYEWYFEGLAPGTYKLGVQAVYPSSQTEIVDTTIHITDASVRFEVEVKANNGKNLDGETVSLMNEDSGEEAEATITDGKAVFPSLLKGKYLLGVTVKNFEVYSQEVDVAADGTVAVTLIEKIITPYNLTIDAKATGVNRNDVLLKWNQNISFTEDFESYKDFASGRFGSWSTYDLDQHICYPIGLGSASNIVYFPGASTPSNPCPVPPMVFNPWKTEPAMMPTDKAVMAPSGDKTIIFFSPQGNGANKWLVSPEILIREDFVCRFTAKAYSEYKESMSVCAFLDGASNPAKDPFEEISRIDALASGQWMIYETDLSKYVGKKIRIGVHYTSFDAFFAQLDDFFVGNLAGEGTTVDVGEVKKYIVTLDGAEAGAVTEPEITLHDVTAGKHTATVQAEYASGMSQMITRNFTVNLGGDINADNKVNVTDVTALINQILGTANYNATLCDVNGDGVVNVSDVTALINLILAK
ncbi:MAG: choice-of-anchor J domain-containing protein [Bacteroidales bacterium]|nr:choice-of-anchor J domain-containing protein [Bacteroidales bacterium]